MENRSPRSRGILGPRPTPLKVRGDSHKIINKPSLAPQPQPQPQPPHTHQLPSQSPAPRITYIRPPKIYKTTPNEFKALVQLLTGMPSTSTASSSSSSSSSAAFDASCGLTENANTSNEQGTFVGGVETMDQYYNQHQQHQHHQIERPRFHPAEILPPEPTSQTLISPDVFSTVGPTEPQDGYWNQQRQYQPPMSSTHHGGHPKRPRSESECSPSAMPSGHDMHNYLSRDEDRGIPHLVKDTRTIGSTYDRYLQSVQTPPIPSEEEADMFNGVGMGRPGGINMMPDPTMGGRGRLLPPDFRPNGQAMDFGQPDLIECSPSAMPSGHNMHNYLSQDEDISYDRYMQTVQTPSMPSEEKADLFNGVGMGRPGGINMMPDPTMGGRGRLLPPDFKPNGRAMGFGQPDLIEGSPSVMPSGHNMHNYLSRDEDISYDRYMQTVQTPSMPSKEKADLFNGVGMGRPGGINMMPDPTMGGRGRLLPPDFKPNGRAMGFGQPDLIEGSPSAMPSGHNMHNYLSRDEDISYDRYMQTVQTPSMPFEEVDMFNGVGMGRPGGNNMMPGPTMGGRGGISTTDFRPNGWAMGFGQPDLIECSPSAMPSGQDTRTIGSAYDQYLQSVLQSLSQVINTMQEHMLHQSLMMS